MSPRRVSTPPTFGPDRAGAVDDRTGSARATKVERRRWLQDIASVLFLLILVLYRFREGALLKVVYSLGDLGSEFLPIRAAAAAALRQFGFLLWSPEVFGGYPTYAHPHTAVFYPVNWILSLLLSPWAAFDYFVLLHVVLGTGFMYLLLRFFGLSSIPCVLGAVIFALNGNRIYDSYLFLGPIAWLPLILLLLEKALAEKDPRYFLVAILVNGMEGVAGSPPMTFVMNVGVFVYVALRLARELRHSNAGRYGVGVLLFYALSFGLMAVQALPTRELARQSSRAAVNWDFITQGSLLPRDLPRLITGHSIEYLGAIPIGLALIALISSRRRRHAGRFAIFTLIALLLCLGKYTPLYRVLFAYVPGFANFRIPFRFFVWVTFGVAVLAAMGLQDLLDRSRRGTLGRRLLPFVAAVPFLATVLDYNRIPRYQFDPSNATPSADLRSPVEVARLLGHGQGRFRVLPRLTKVNIWSPFSAKRQILEGNSPLLAGLESSAGYMPLHYVPYMNLFNRLDQVDGDARLRLASFLNIGHVVTDSGYPPGFPAGRLVFRAATRSGIRLFDNPEALPRVVIADSFLVEPNSERAIGLLLTGEWDPHTRLQVESARLVPGGYCGSPLHASVTRVAYGATRVEIDATTNCAAILCLRDTFYPGWQATIDGNRVPLFQTDLIYRGVELRPGTNHVMFRYRPRSLALGATASLLTFAIILGGLAWSSRTRRRRAASA